jgi:subtilisin-like proprotein convertase family protein
LVKATYIGNATFATSNATVNQRVDNNTSQTGATYCNTGALAITDNGPSTPYPSNIFISGAPTYVIGVTATLKNVSHTFDGDIEAMLVGPAGQNLVVVSDAGTAPVSNVTVNLNDAAAGLLPVAGSWAAANSTITVKPTNYNELTPDSFPAPAPAPSAATTLSTFNATNPNGTWSLYVKDDGAPDTGSIAGGWCLNFTFDTTPPTVSIVQAAGQGDPTQHSPINFTATFSETVTGFTGADVTFAGSTAGGTKVATVTGGPSIYNVAVTGMTTSGTVVATIPAGGAFDVASNGNTASSGGDNVVNWVLDATKATCSYTIVPTPAPAHIDFTVTDVGSGVASITFPTLNNIVTPVPVPAFTPGTTSPISFTATKANNAMKAQIAVVITDVAGNQSSCV